MVCFWIQGGPGGKRRVFGNGERTPLDECRHVYKDLDAVLRMLEEGGIADAAHRLYPVANIKGVD